MEIEQYKRYVADSFGEVEKFAKSFINNNSITIVVDDSLTDIDNHIYSVNYVLNQIASNAKYYANIFALWFRYGW